MMSFFGLREWKFCNKNIDQLATLLKSQRKNREQKANDLNDWQNGYMQSNSITNSCNENGRLHESDKKKLHRSHDFLEFDMRTIDWNEYFFHYLPGIKKYFFKETVTKKCVAHYRKYVGFHFINPDTFMQISCIYMFLICKIFRLKIIHIIFKSAWNILLFWLGTSVAFKYLLRMILP